MIALTEGNAKVALARQGDAWTFPSLRPARQAGSLEDELETALDAAEQQLGLDLTDTLCSQPVIQVCGAADAPLCPCCRPPPPPPPPPPAACRRAVRPRAPAAAEAHCTLFAFLPNQALGPGPRETTKFFVALNVPEVGCLPAHGWTDMHAAAVAGLVATL